MIRSLEEFVYGQYRTYQVSIRQIEQKTGLSFGRLSTFDPLRGQENFRESERLLREIRRFEDLVL